MAERFAKDYGVSVDWQPFLLRPEAPREGWPLPSYIAARMNQPGNPLQLRAAELGLPLVERAWVSNSRLALAANERIREHGLDRLDAFHSEVNKRYWAQGEDISRQSVLEEAARAIGVEGGLDDLGALEARVDESIERAYELGIHAVPTYVFFDGPRPVGAIQGAQPYEVFQHAAGQLGLVVAKR